MKNRCCDICHRNEEFYNEVIASIRNEAASEKSSLERAIQNARGDYLAKNDLSARYLLPIFGLSPDFSKLSIESLLKDETTLVKLEPRLGILLDYYRNFIEGELRPISQAVGFRPVVVGDLVRVLDLEPLDFRWNDTTELQDQVRAMVETLESLPNEVRFFEYSAGLRSIGKNLKIGNSISEGDNFPLDYVRGPAKLLSRYESQLALCVCPVCYKMQCEVAAGSLQRLQQFDWD